jgi:GTP-binding protein
VKTETAQFEAAAGLAKQLLPPELPEIVFAGRSNVGKSSLINKILNRKSLARTSAQPGKTATINFYRLSTLRLVDLPGYGFARVSHSEKKRWGELIEGYFNQERPIKLVIQLIDARHTPSADDLTMLDYLRQIGHSYLIALTKIDKLNKGERAERLALFPHELGEIDTERIVPFSAVTGEGAEVIRELIEEAVSNV